MQLRGKEKHFWKESRPPRSRHQFFEASNSATNLSKQLHQIKVHNNQIKNLDHGIKEAHFEGDELLMSDCSSSEDSASDFDKCPEMLMVS